MKTLLVNPPWFCLMNRERHDVHLGLAYVAGALTASGFDVRILDGERVLAPYTLDRNARTPPTLFHATEQYVRNHDLASPIWARLGDAVIAESPDIVGLTSWSGAYQSTVNTCKVIKARDRRIITVVGGVHATLDPHSFMKHPEVDFVVCGEGELASQKLWKVLSEGGDAHRKSTEIKGVWTRVEGNVHGGGRTELARSLDEVPLPNYDCIIGGRTDWVPGIVTSRGCPFRCGFCASQALWTSKVRYRSIDSVISELELYRDRFGLSFFRINDDSFCLRKSRVLEFCDKLVKRFGRRRLKFFADANADTVDDEIIAKLERAGCRTLCVGVESVAPRIRKRFIRKKVDLDHVRQIVSRMNRTRIRSGVYFLTGFPHETQEELMQTVRFMEEAQARMNEWGIVTPYPGTELYRYAIEKGILPDADPIHLMHHSLKTSMADIPLERHEEILRQVLEICERLSRPRPGFRERWRMRLRHPRKSLLSLFGKAEH